MNKQNFLFHFFHYKVIKYNNRWILTACVHILYYNMKNFDKIIEYVNSSCWKDHTKTCIIIEKAQEIFNRLIDGKTKKKFLYRLCGQTGSGKTTQLLPAVKRVAEVQNLKPVVLGVRTCAQAHPNYEYFKDHFPPGELREKTNGFALKCMSYVLKLLIENGYMILLDITLLDPIFEKFLLDLLNRENYCIEYHILAVNKLISNKFIEKRQQKTGRIIYKSSADYFYQILPEGLRYITSHDCKNNCFVWNAFDTKPVYMGKVCKCFNQFLKAREEIKPLSHTEEELVSSKFNIILSSKK